MNHADTYVECLHWLCFAEEISAYFQIHMIFLSWIWDGLSDTFNVSKVLNIYYLTIYHVFHTQNATRWLYLYAWLSHRRNNLILWVSLSQIECIWNMLKPLASWRTSCCAVCLLHLPPIYHDLCTVCHPEIRSLRFLGKETGPWRVGSDCAIISSQSI